MVCVSFVINFRGKNAVVACESVYAKNSEPDCSIILTLSARLNFGVMVSSQRTAWCWWCWWIVVCCSLSKSISSSSSSSSSSSRSWSMSSSVQLIIKWFKCGGTLVGGNGGCGIIISSSLLMPNDKLFPLCKWRLLEPKPENEFSTNCDIVLFCCLIANWWWFQLKSKIIIEFWFAFFALFHFSRWLFFFIFFFARKINRTSIRSHD